MPSKKDILDLHFMDARYKLIDLAAFLDRVERHAGEADFRLAGLKKALPILLSDQPGRRRRYWRRCRITRRNRRRRRRSSLRTGRRKREEITNH